MGWLNGPYWNQMKVHYKIAQHCCLYRATLIDGMDNTSLHLKFCALFIEITQYHGHFSMEYALQAECMKAFYPHLIFLHRKVAYKGEGFNNFEGAYLNSHMSLINRGAFSHCHQARTDTKQSHRSQSAARVLWSPCTPRGFFEPCRGSSFSYTIMC